METTLLIVLPIAAAVALWIFPWASAKAAAAFALLIALGELALWIGVVLNFDFAFQGLQGEADRTWFADLDVSYRVGLYDYSLWLVGLTVVVTAAAVGYGFWVGRERPGVYLSLLLFLEGATIGVFTAQDLVLFYVFWEAMLIPLYVLIGVWGGPGRLGATFKFVAYTIAGSLLMLVAIIAAGLGAGTFDMTQLVGQGTSTWIFLGFAIAFAVKAPLWPFHGWLPDAYRESPPEVAAVLSGVISKAGAYGFLAIAIPFYPGPASDWRTPCARPLVDRARLRLAARLPCARRARGDRVLEPGADEPDPDRDLRGQLVRLHGRAAPDGQPRPHLGGALPPGRGDRAPHDHR